MMGVFFEMVKTTGHRTDFKEGLMTMLAERGYDYRTLKITCDKLTDSKTKLEMENENKKSVDKINSSNEKLLLSDAIKSICEHKNQERIDFGTNICKDCKRLINTTNQTVL